MEQVYVIVTRGDGASTRIVTESCLKNAVHAALCTCEALLGCQTSGVPEIIAELDNEDMWTHPYPDRERHEWFAEFEDGDVYVFRLDEPRPITLEDITKRISDPGAFLMRGDNYQEPIPVWSARAVHDLVAEDPQMPSPEAVRNFRWAYKLLLALAKRCLKERNEALVRDGEPNTWPAGQEWHEMVGSSHSVFLHIARDEAGIDRDEFLAQVRSGRYDVDDLYEQARQQPPLQFTPQSVHHTDFAAIERRVVEQICARGGLPKEALKGEDKGSNPEEEQ